MTTTNRQKLAERIKALLEKTTDRGCTEAEAMSAAEKAAELIRLYQIDLSDVDMEAEGFIRQTYTNTELKAYHLPDAAIQNILWGVGRFTDCRAWSSQGWGSGKNHVVGDKDFFGLRSDVEFAHFLFDALCHWVRRAAASQSLFLNGKREVNDFIMGCSVRLYERLKEEGVKHAATSSGSGRDIVICKTNLRDREFAKLGIKLGGGIVRGGHGGAFAAGYTTGGKAGFGKPVGSSSVGRIGYSGGGK